ncbi:MAG: phage holin family protein [Clostridiales bacterium]|nr:phage holin family protein [Clostridiales bacterium]
MTAFFANLYNELTCECGIKALLAFAWSFILTSVGYPETAVIALLYLFAADFFLGFSRAWQSHSLRGDKICAGAYKLVAYWASIAIFVQADRVLLNAFPFDVSLTNLLIAYLGVNEALSCLTHLQYFGLPVPEYFIKRLRKYKEQVEITADADPSKSSRSR